MRKLRSRSDRLTVGYIRVSTQEQAEFGSSLGAQRDRIASYASGVGRGPLDRLIIDDGHSGGSLNRPGITNLLEALKAGSIRSIIVAKLDRLSRSLRDVLDILDLCIANDTALLSASETLDTSNAVGKMLIHLLATFGEFERGRISERTTDVLTYKRKSLEVYGPTPFGYRREGRRLVLDPTQQKALALIRALETSGVSLRGIAKRLADEGYAPPKGKAWHAQSVRRVLLSKMTSEAVL